MLAAMILLNESRPVAKKAYHCNACEFLHNVLNDSAFIFTIGEYRAIVKAKRNGWKITAQQRYLKQVQVDPTARQIFVFRAIPEIDDLCWKYDLYPEE